MTLYRAHYQTQAGADRRMTFAAPGLKAAYALAQAWELADDTLQAVAELRPLQRPLLELQA